MSESGVLNDDLNVAVLGPVEIAGHGGTSVLSGTNLPALVCLLALTPGRAVHNDRLLEALWPGAEPDRAKRSLISLVHQLNAVLQPHSGRPSDSGRGHMVRTIKGVGRALRVQPDAVDLSRFERAIAAADLDQAAGRIDPAIAGYRTALALWRGTPFGGIDLHCFVDPVARLEMLRVRAEAAVTELSLRQGHGAALVPMLWQHCEHDPHDEHVASLLARALYQAGRSADALAALRRCTVALRDRGLAPTPALARLELSILDHTLEPATGATGRADAADRAEGADRAQGGRLVVSPPQLLAARVEHFVGRDRELQVLTDTWRMSVQGCRPVLAALRGRAGMGKTALAARFADHVAADTTSPALRHGAAIDFLRARSTESQPLAVLGPWLLRIATAASDQTTAANDQTTAAADQTTAAADRSMAAVQVAQILSGESRLDDVDAPLFVQQAGALLGSSITRPTVLIVDDMQWCDELSRNILRSVLNGTVVAPLMVLTTERAGHQPRLTVSDEVELTLAPFEADEVRQLAAALDSSMDATELRRRTDGIPLFVGLALDGGGDYSRRLATLSDRARSTLLAAAVLGTSCRVAHVVLLTGAGELDIIEALDDAGRAGLAHLTPDGDRIEFFHDLGRDHVLASTSVQQVCSLSALALQRLPSDAIDTSARLELARSAGNAIDVDQLTDITCRAVRAALAGLSFEQARRDVELTLADPRAASGAQRGTLLVLAARAMIGAGDNERAQSTIGQVRAIVAANPDPLLEAEIFSLELMFGTGSRSDAVTAVRLLSIIASLGSEHQPLVYRLRRRLFVEQMNAGDPHAARATLDAMRAQLVEDDEGFESADLMPLENWVADTLADFAATAQVQQRAIALSRLQLPARAMTRVYQTRSYDAINAGDTALLDHVRQRVAHYAGLAGEPHAAWQAEAARFVLALWAGDVPAARRATDEAFQYGAQRGVVSASEAWQAQAFVASWACGDVGELAGFLRHVPNIVDTPWAAALALAEALDGNVDVADLMLNDVISDLGRWRTHYFDAIVVVVAAETALVLGRTDLADVLWHALARRRGRHASFGGFVDFGPVDLTLARCARQMGKHDLASELSAPLLCEHTPDLWRRRAQIEDAMSRGEPMQLVPGEPWAWLGALDLEPGRR